MCGITEPQRSFSFKDLKYYYLDFAYMWARMSRFDLIYFFVFVTDRYILHCVVNAPLFLINISHKDTSFIGEWQQCLLRVRLFMFELGIEVETLNSILHLNYL